MTPDPGEDEERDPLEGRYANYFEVGHNGFEFVLDFGQFYRDVDRPQFHTRIVTSPAYAKALARLLAESLGRYEETFGPLPRSDNE